MNESIEESELSSVYPEVLTSPSQKRLTEPQMRPVTPYLQVEVRNDGENPPVSVLGAKFGHLR
jgi:hypothetical protein